MSSSTLAISIRGLSKAYTIRHNAPTHTTLSDALVDRFKHPFRSSKKEVFRALNNVTFDIQKGEIVGIIGRNGAGKSTLLKILSRITRPTDGAIDLYGRVGSLLEVGTGFHQELSGRENIHLNGSILGMTRREVAQQFDEIVSFAGVEQFLDTPVKRYSSGMYVRLAFAVAAHLNPEILIIDEVLAVGDLEFQKKCLRKMGDVAQSGRTVLFVSHQMSAVQTLCTRSILLEKGKVIADGAVDDCVKMYLRETGIEDLTSAVAVFDRPPGATCWIRQARLLSCNQDVRTISMGNELVIEIEFAADPPTQNPRFGFIISDANGTAIMNANNRYLPFTDPPSPVEKGVISCNLGRLHLVPGKYLLTLIMGDTFADDHVIRDHFKFEVLPHDLWGTGQVPPPNSGAVWLNTAFELRLTS